MPEETRNRYINSPVPWYAANWSLSQTGMRKACNGCNHPGSLSDTISAQHKGTSDDTMNHAESIHQHNGSISPGRESSSLVLECKNRFFCPWYDGRQRNLLSILLPDLVPNITVIVRPNRHGLIINQLLLWCQFSDNIILNFLADFPAHTLPLITHSKLTRTLTIPLDPFEKLPPLQSQ